MPHRPLTFESWERGLQRRNIRIQTSNGIKLKESLNKNSLDRKKISIKQKVILFASVLRNDLSTGKISWKFIKPFLDPTALLSATNVSCHSMFLPPRLCNAKCGNINYYSFSPRNFKSHKLHFMMGNPLIISTSAGIYLYLISFLPFWLKSMK